LRCVAEVQVDPDSTPGRTRAGAFGKYVENPSQRIPAR